VKDAESIVPGSGVSVNDVAAPLPLLVDARPVRSDDAPRLLTYRQAAAILGVVDRTIYNLVRRGELPAVRFGGNVRIDPRDLEAFIEKAKGRACRSTNDS